MLGLRPRFSLHRQTTGKVNLPLRLHCPLFSLIRHLYYCPCKSVSKQRTLSPFRMNTYEKHGGGGLLWLTRNLMKGFCPERPSGAKDLSSTPTGKARLNPRDRGKKLAAAWVARLRSAGSRTLPPAGWRREATLRDSTALPAEGDRSEARWQQRKSG